MFEPYPVQLEPRVRTQTLTKSKTMTSLLLRCVGKNHAPRQTSQQHLAWCTIMNGATPYWDEDYVESGERYALPAHRSKLRIICSALQMGETM